MQKLLIATTNPGKVAEYRNLLKDEPFLLVTLNDVKIKMPVEEDGVSFEENASKKAMHYVYFSGLPTIADDGGIEVEALNGAPGVLSRRWPGYEATDEELIDMMLVKMAGIPQERRGARFRIALAFAVPGEETVWVREGALDGYIAEQPTQFIPGYPFRALFLLPEYGKTLGEFTPEEETALVLHRKKALEQLLPIMREKLG